MARRHGLDLGAGMAGIEPEADGALELAGREVELAGATDEAQAQQGFITDVFVNVRSSARREKQLVAPSGLQAASRRVGSGPT
jgi:hypothetical protein